MVRTADWGEPGWSRKFKFLSLILDTAGDTGAVSMQWSSVRWEVCMVAIDGTGHH